MCDPPGSARAEAMPLLLAFSLYRASMHWREFGSEQFQNMASSKLQEKHDSWSSFAIALRAFRRKDSPKSSFGNFVMDWFIKQSCRTEHNFRLIRSKPSTPAKVWSLSIRNSWRWKSRTHLSNTYNCSGAIETRGKSSPRHWKRTFERISALRTRRSSASRLRTLLCRRIARSVRLA